MENGAGSGDIKVLAPELMIYIKISISALAEVLTLCILSTDLRFLIIR